MANENQLEILLKGSEVWNKWLVENRTAPIDLSGADLSHKYLYFTNLSHTNLHGANLTSARLCGARLGGATLTEADLSKADLSDAHLANTRLSNANLSNADLSNADLSGADFGYANLNGANLNGANLNGANLSGANLSGAQCGNTVFASVNLSNAKSLDFVKHVGPSSLGIETLLISGGSIPVPFLEGCGVPDQWIDYLPSLLGIPIDFYSCFISYSHEDEEFCEQIHSRMRADKLRVWYAPEDIKGGKKIHEQIDQAIRIHEKLLIVLSEHSMESEWVKTEIRHARKREVEEGRRILFPIRLVPYETIRDWKAFDADTGKDMAVEIREYFIPDFSNWKDHDSFQESYQRLMKDFKPSPGI